METDSAQMSASAAWHTSSRPWHSVSTVLNEALFANLSSLALSSSLSIGQNATQDRQHIFFTSPVQPRSLWLQASDSLNKMESLLLSLGRQPTTDRNMVEAADP